MGTSLESASPLGKFVGQREKKGRLSVTSEVWKPSMRATIKEIRKNSKKKKEKEKKD